MLHEHSTAPATPLVIFLLLLLLLTSLLQRPSRYSRSPQVSSLCGWLLDKKVPGFPKYGVEGGAGAVGPPISWQDCLVGAACASLSHRLLQKPGAGKGAIKFSKRHFPWELLMRHVVSENRNRLQAALWHPFNQPASAFPCQSSESPDEADSCVTGKQSSGHVGCICARSAKIHLIFKIAIPMRSRPCATVPWGCCPETMCFIMEWD